MMFYAQKEAITPHVNSEGQDQPVLIQSDQDLLYWYIQQYPNYSVNSDCVEVLWASQPNGVMSSMVSLSNHFYWAGLVF